MNKTRCIGAVIIVGGMFLFMILALGVISVFLYSRFRSQRVADLQAPEINVRLANEKVILLPGEPYPVSVSASDTNPVERVEMWLDGELAKSETPAPSFSSQRRYVNLLFHPSLSEGIHTIYWRAFDEEGAIGQSEMVAVKVLARDQLSMENNSREVNLAGTSEGEGGDEFDEEETESSAEDELVVVFSSSGSQPTPTQDEQDLEAGKEPDVLDIPNPGEIPLPESPPPGLEPVPEGVQVAPIDPHDLAEPRNDFTPLPIPPAGAIPLGEINALVGLNPFKAFSLPELPAAPSGLSAGFENCTVRLVWNDNADNESSFNVWIQRLGGPPQLISTLQGAPLTGPVIYEFPAPPFGIYTVWIEAVNGVLRQPSEIKGFAVNKIDCPQDALAGNLEIEVVEMGVYPSNLDKVYCYLSLENYLHQRIPGSASEFMEITGMSADIDEGWIGDNRILLPIPQDGEVSLTGECWQFTSGTNSPPVLLGDFSTSVPMEMWDGRRLKVGKPGIFDIIYTIRYYGSRQVVGKSKFIDTSIPAPTDLVVHVEHSPDPLQEAVNASQPTLTWKWKGDPSQLRGGYNILNKGKHYSTGPYPLGQTSMQLTLSSTCGQIYEFQVEASSGYASSLPSNTAVYEQPPCEVMAEVHFQSTFAASTDDTGFNPFVPAGGVAPGQQCDELQVWGFLWVISAAGSKIVEIASQDNPSDFKCNTEYTFTQLGASKDKFILPLDPDNPFISAETWLIEKDGFSDSEIFYDVNETISGVPLGDWLILDREKTYFPPDNSTASGVEVKMRIRGILYANE